MRFSLLRILLVFVLATCASASLAAPITLTWRGDITTANGIINDVANAWRQQGQQPLKLEPFNTVSGIDALLQGRADMAGSARGPAGKRNQEEALEFVPVAWGTLAIIANASNPVKGLSVQQLRDVYLGKIKNWNQLGGPNAPINVYAVASPTDGVEFSLRELLFGRGNQPVAAPRLYLDVRKMQQAIALDPNGFGVSMLSNMQGNQKIKALAVDNVAANPQNVKNGRYPLFAALYIVAHKERGNSAKSAQIDKFIEFAQSSQNDAILTKHQIIPYREFTPDPKQQAQLAAARKPQASGKSKPAQKQQAPAAPSSQVHTVVQGDTLAKIGRKYGVSVDDIRAWNNLSGDLIKVGQKLTIQR